jgi:hypothetical protein
VLDGVVAAAMRPDDIAGPQRAHDLHRLLEHLAAHRGGRPAVAVHGLVEPLAGADAEEEPARHHRRCRRGRVGDDRRVRADRRARHRGPDPDALGDLRDRAEHAPHERRLPLPQRPRVEVVGDRDEGEAGLLGPARRVDQQAGRVLLGRQVQSDAQPASAHERRAIASASSSFVMFERPSMSSSFARS